MYKWFKPHETACKCGCGLNIMAKSTMTKLDRARDIAGFPVLIASACRCAVHNASVGGSHTSSHLADPECHAVDIVAITTQTRRELIAALLNAGFNRIGIGKTFLHADDDPKKDTGAINIWFY